VKPGSKDTWDGFNDEREEIFGFIQDNKIEGVVLMAADRHRVDYRKTPRPKGYDLYEMMSARLTNMHTHGLVENAEGSEFIMGHNKTPAFAKVEIDTTLDDPTLTYRIITIENEEVGKAELKLSELKFEK
jgi:alkaline phosphatase D